MKRLLKAILVMALFFGIGAAVYADDLPGDMDRITVRKELDTTGGNPEETFNFTVGAGELIDGAGSAPTIAGFGIKVLAGQGSGSHELMLPGIGANGFDQVGTFKYEIKETAGNTAGMIYDTDSRFLIVQVLNGPDGLIRVAYLMKDGEKLEIPVIANNEFNSGDLTFKKIMEGNYINPDDTFTITVTLTAKAGKTFNADAMSAAGATNTITVVGNQVILTYTVKHNSEFTIQDIPFDVDFAIVETGFDGYDPEYVVSYTGANGEMNEYEMSALITNTRNRDIDTGINLDNMPYLLALTFAIGGLGFVMVRRRREH